MNFVSYYCPNLFYENSQINEWILCDERLSLNHKTFGKLEALPENFDAETFSIEADRLITESQFLKYIHLIKDFYYLGETNIIDAAVLWRRNSYIPGTFMCLSFQFRKHLSLGRGGMILTDNKSAANDLKKMSYDGRIPVVPWREQNISTMGYHYYMTPETAQNGMDKLQEAINTPPVRWRVTDWPDLTEMDIFKNKNGDF